MGSSNVVKTDVDKMEQKSGMNIEVPCAAEMRLRIFAVFRTLHWRIARKLAAGSYAVYGVDDGLREADGDVRMKKIKDEHPLYDRLMTTEKWTPRGFCGYDSKKL